MTLKLQSYSSSGSDRKEKYKQSGVRRARSASKKIDNAIFSIKVSHKVLPSELKFCRVEK